MSYGCDWTCECGWGNLDIRKECRHCGKANPAPAQDAPQVSGDVADRLRTEASDGWSGDAACVSAELAADAAAEIADLRAKLANAEARLLEARDALGQPADWAGRLAELYTWAGSAFLAGEKVKNEAGHKTQLYGFLCSLVGYLMAGETAAREAQALTLARAETGASDV